MREPGCSGNAQKEIRRAPLRPSLTARPVFLKHRVQHREQHAPQPRASRRAGRGPSPGLRPARVLSPCTTRASASELGAQSGGQRAVHVSRRQETGRTGVEGGFLRRAPRRPSGGSVCGSPRGANRLPPTPCLPPSAPRDLATSPGKAVLRCFRPRRRLTIALGSLPRSPAGGPLLLGISPGTSSWGALLCGPR